jgi:hypothetical protein
MSTSAAEVSAGAVTGAGGRSFASELRAYFASDSSRTVQTALGLIWLLDGALQFQSWMYTNGFTRMLQGMMPGQPGWLNSSINWAAHTETQHMAIYNTLFALVQVAIGLGLLYRPMVKPALALSFGWVLIVWWFGEAFGMLFMSMSQPLTGAPGAVSLYALIGLIAWPGRPGGVLGIRGARIAWGALWILMAWLWLAPESSSANATTNAINAAPSGMSWLSTVQNWAAARAAGDGLVIALVLAALSLAIGLAVAFNRRPVPFLALAVVLSLAFWVFGQGLGGIAEGNATDPNAGPLFVLLAYALYALVPLELPSASAPRLIPEPGGS